MSYDFTGIRMGKKKVKIKLQGFCCFHLLKFGLKMSFVAVSSVALLETLVSSRLVCLVKLLLCR